MTRAWEPEKLVRIVPSCAFTERPRFWAARGRAAERIRARNTIPGTNRNFNSVFIDFTSLL
jgi:hypothetical protein